MANRYLPLLLAAGALGAWRLLSRKPSTGSTPSIAPDFAAPPGACFPDGVDMDEVRAAVDNALLVTDSTKDASEQAVIAASAALRDLCPSKPTPSMPYEVPNYEQANGEPWTQAFNAAWQYASGKLVPPPV